MVMVWIHKTPAIHRQRLFGQFILLSGALGNLLDRAQYGYVIDFIDVHYQNYYWPVFNVADSLIFIGVILLIFERQTTFSLKVFTINNLAGVSIIDLTGRI